MKPCTRVGINVTHRCNCNCLHCFYRWGNEAKNGGDRSLREVVDEATAGAARGCDHVVLVGWGEPTLWTHLTEAVKEFKNIGMSSSIITNGTASIMKYDELRAAGLNHLHLSVHHGYGLADEIMGHDGASSNQNALMVWLHKEKWPWRANMSVQRINYMKILSTGVKCMAYGCRHFIVLGFLPLYGWAEDLDRARQVMVDPADASNYISDIAALFNDRALPDPSTAPTLTIRYHPMCLLEKEAWKYVVNTRYVLYDPWEWDYGACGLAPESLWNRAVDFGNSVAIQGQPCCNCDLLMHCGGWNRTYYAAYPDCGIHAIKDPEIQQVPGWLHDQNPANHEKGWFQ